MSNTAVVFDFAENSVWDNSSQIRTRKVQAVFELITFVKVEGKRLRREVRMDYTAFFDPEDEIIKSVLGFYAPEIPWQDMIYTRAMDNSRIFIAPVDSFREVAELRLRGIGSKRRLTDDELIELGVTPLFKW
jgi:hypothetical protein